MLGLLDFCSNFFIPNNFGIKSRFFIFLFSVYCTISLFFDLFHVLNRNGNIFPDLRRVQRFTEAELDPDLLGDSSGGRLRVQIGGARLREAEGVTPGRRGVADDGARPADAAVQLVQGARDGAGAGGRGAHVVQQLPHVVVPRPRLLQSLVKCDSRRGLPALIHFCCRDVIGVTSHYSRGYI